MRFVVDESSFAVPVAQRSFLEGDLEDFLGRIRTAQERGEGVTFHRSLYELTEVQEYLFSRKWLAPDLTSRVLMALDRLPCWEDTANEIPWPEAVEIEGTMVPFAPSIAYAQGRTLAGNSMACFSLRCSGRSGELRVRLGIQQGASVWFVVDEEEHIGFFRTVLDREARDESAFAQLAPSAYPGLFFVEGVWHGLRRFSKPFTEIRADLCKVFAILSDQGHYIFSWDENSRSCRAKNHEIESRFSGFALAPENPYDLADPKVEESRTRHVGGEPLVCHWHIKLERDRDRIYLHPPTSTTDGRTVIGFLHKHLPLRGER